MRSAGDRIVWLIPSLLRGGYWAPFLNAIVAARPDTAVVTAAVEDDVRQRLAMAVVQVGRLRSVGHASEPTGYRYGVNMLSLGVVRILLNLLPGVVVCVGFSMWTGLALLIRPWLRYRVCIYIAGNSQSASLVDRPLRLGVRKRLARSADVLITNSSAGADYLVGVLGARPDVVHAFPMMVPEPRAEERFDGCVAAQESESLGPTRILYAGRLERAKGVGDLLDALLLVTDVPGDSAGWRLTIVGDGSDRRALEERVASEPALAGLTTFVGWKSRDELAGYLDSADLFVYPTYDDIWGSAPLEAMAHGVPVVISTAAGMADLIEPGVNGEQFTAGDVRGLAACLTRLLGDCEALPEMGRRALGTVSANSPARAGETFLSLMIPAEDGP